MTETIQRKLNDSPVARWTALILIALTMFFGYMLVDVLSPLQNMLEVQRGWTPKVFGFYGSSEFILNVFVGFLIFAGIILDKLGIRFTGVLSASLMVVGASVKLYGVSDYFNAGGFGYEFFNSFLVWLPASAKVACLGFMIFGCGVEMAGVTVSKAIAKWFKGKEMALAMGLEMAIARLGVFAVFHMSPWLANMGEPSIVRPLAFNVLLLLIGLLTFVVFTFMDRKLDRQQGCIEEQEEEQFRISDIGKLLTSKTFMTVAALCVLYYSAIFPFQRFATGMLESRLGLPTDQASALFAWFPIGAMLLTPLLGAFLDHRGKGASMLMLGAVLMCGCHMIFALAPMTRLLAYAAILLLGISFSLVPAALWPSVPKLVEERYLGSAYSVIFWIQNFGLWALPNIIGWSLNAVNPGVADNIQQLQKGLEILQTQQTLLAETTFRAEDQNAVYYNEFADGIFTREHKDQVFLNKYLSDINSRLETDLNNAPAWKQPALRQQLTDRIGEVRTKLKALADAEELNAPDSLEPIITNIDAGIAEIKAVKGSTVYDYKIPMLIFASLGIFAFLLAFYLKQQDRKYKYGLELPNIKK